jgi:hypothetical protein
MNLPNINDNCSDKEDEKDEVYTTELTVKYDLNVRQCSDEFSAFGYIWFGFFF